MEAGVRFYEMAANKNIAVHQSNAMNNLEFGEHQNLVKVKSLAVSVK